MSSFLLRTIANNLKTLIAGVLLGGAAGFVVASTATKYYVSSAYLAINEDSARSANAIMSSPPVVDKVLAKIRVPGDTVEARRRFIDDSRRIVVAPNEIPRTSKMYRLDFTGTDPHFAQQANSLLIGSWIESTKPPPNRSHVIQTEIDRLELQATTISDLLEKLMKEAEPLLSQTSIQGEFATPIVGLVTKRDQNLATVITLKQQLLGVSEDVIFSPPGLPEESVSPRRGLIAVLSAVGGGLLMLAFFMLRAAWSRWGP